MTFKSYRKKPVVIEAIQWTGDNIIDVVQFVQPEKLNNKDPESLKEYFRNRGYEINTLEGVMTADIGDYIIKGIKGEFYPCKPDIFEATYEIV